MLSSLNEKELKEFLSHFEKKEVKAGEYIIKEGQKCDYAIFVEKGEIEVIKTTYNKKEYVVAVFHPEDRIIFNEISLIDEKESFSTLKALKDSIIRVIHKRKFFNFVYKNKDIGIKILENMLINCAKHLRKRDEDIIALFNTIEILLNE
jgi:CRP-like cAMP-binding protein